MAKYSLVNLNDSKESIENIQADLVYYIIHREFWSILNLLEAKGSYFSKFIHAIDAVKLLREIDFLEGLIDQSLRVSNNSKFIDGCLYSVWTFEFLRLKNQFDADVKLISMKVETKEINIVVRVKNDKICFLDWCTKYIHEADLKRNIIQN